MRATIMQRTIPLLALAIAFPLQGQESRDEVRPPPALGLPQLVIPENNPQSPEKIALGEKLFNDKRFSSTGTVSCASCHAPAKAFTDETGPRPVSVGIGDLTGTRNAPTVLNAAFNRTQFWDG